MTPERWQRIKEIFNAALDRAPEERASFVDSQAGDDEEIRREVHQLVAAHGEPTQFLDTPAFEVAAQTLAVDRDALAPGQRVGRYLILHQLGAGGMGEVYLAEDTRLGRKVALKFLPASLTGDPARVGRFEQEARAASALNHPNVSTIHEFGEDEAGRYFIAMEHVDGVTLRRRLEEGPIALAEALDVAAQVAAALQVAHEAGVVHRDVKPENVMLRRDGIAKVVDFGIAKLGAQPAEPDAPARSLVDTGAGTLVGTAAYMSPEQARGAAVDERTDVWSLGVVLYEMVSGRKPFAGETASELIAGVIDREPPPLTVRDGDVPPGLARVVRKALEKDRERRYRGMSEMALDIKALRRELEAAPVRPRRPLALAVAALVVAAALGVGLWLALGGRDASGPFRTTKITRLTTSGNAVEATISRDGSKVAYVVEEGGRQSLRVRPVAVASEVELVSSNQGDFVGLDFSPDGGFVYYALFARDYEGGTTSLTLYRVATSGGAPQPVAEHVTCAARQVVTFGPDGRIAFVRLKDNTGDPALYDTNDAALYSANPDGSDQRVMLERPERGPAAWPAWSPDGRTMACGVYDPDGFIRLLTIDLASGEERILSDQPWSIPGVERVAWLADGSGLVVSGMTESSPFMQLWHISYPSGALRKILDDPNRYEGVGLAADMRAMVSVQSTSVSNLWVAPALDPQRATRVTSGTSRYYDLSWTPDGRILYATDASGDADVWSIGADGTGARQLTTGTGLNYSPTATADGRYVVFHSNRTGVWMLWRMNPDGTDPVELAPGSWPWCTPDSRWVYYSTPEGLARISIDGGEPVRLTPAAGSPAISPDGRFVACIFQERPGSLLKIAIIPVDGGPPLRLLDVPVPKEVYGPSYCWTPDGRGLIYADGGETGTNLWLQPLGGGPAQQLTHFESEQINSFDVAPDGRIVMSRGTPTSDVVLITAVE